MHFTYSTSSPLFLSHRSSSTSETDPWTHYPALRLPCSALLHHAVLDYWTKSYLQSAKCFGTRIRRVVLHYLLGSAIVQYQWLMDLPRYHYRMIAKCDSFANYLFRFSQCFLPGFDAIVYSLRWNFSLLNSQQQTGIGDLSACRGDPTDSSISWLQPNEDLSEEVTTTLAFNTPKVIYWPCWRCSSYKASLIARLAMGC